MCIYGYAELLPPLTLPLTLTLTLCFVVGVLGYDYHNKAGPGGETTHLGLFSILRHPSPHPNPNQSCECSGEERHFAAAEGKHLIRLWVFNQTQK